MQSVGSKRHTGSAEADAPSHASKYSNHSLTHPNRASPDIHCSSVPETMPMRLDHQGR